jgi:TolA-binding protein
MNSSHANRPAAGLVRVCAAWVAAALMWFGPVGAVADTPEELLQQAQQLERAGTLPRAVALYQEFVQRHPGHSQLTEVNYRLARCYDGMGMVDEAMEHLKKVVEQGPRQFRNRADAWYMLAKFHASLKNYPEAIAAFETLLAEGAGLYEEEALNLSGGYYAILEKWEDAAAKLNILKRRKDSPFAEQAAYKLAVLWLRAGQLEQGVDAIQDLARQFPHNKQLPELLLRTADAYRQQRKFDQTIALCEQINSVYPRSIEAVAASYMAGLCYRDRGQFHKAVAAFEVLAAVKQYQARGIAAEALLAAADLYMTELNDPDRAIARYEEAAKLARESDSDRKLAILEQCYFRLGEYYFHQKKWSVALENYLLLRHLGTSLNILGRILNCQAELDAGNVDKQFTAADIERVREKIEANPGTAIAAEAELFLLDRRMADAIRRKAGLAAIAAEYEALADKYPSHILATDNLQSYIWAQAGYAWSQGETKDELSRAVQAYEKAIAANPSESNPYRVPSLENLALAAERAGDKPRAIRTYNELFTLSNARLQAGKDDAATQARTLDYLRSLVTRADTKDLVQQSLKLCQGVIDEKGALSDLAREARYYMAELHYISKDFSAAARTFKDFIRIHGPKQNADGDFADGPWQPAKPDERVNQVYEAALRIAHCWYMQGHQQNMVRAYEWIVRNVPHHNPRMAEAQYWLAMERAKGKQAETPEAKLTLAETLWKNVVHPSLDFDDKNFDKQWHPWVGARDAVKYVKPAMLKSGQMFSEARQHEVAARVFEKYLERFPLPRDGGRRGAAVEVYDQMHDIARYALGREYVALKNIPRLLTCYRPYLDGLRESPYRVSALKLLGHHAGQDAQYGVAIDAYATLLDEYGENRRDNRNNLVPVPRHERLTQGRSSWDGIRLPVPKDLDPGEIRFALGHLYWRQEHWSQCVKALQAFLEDPALAKNRSRDKALYMIGRSYYHMHDYARGVKAIQRLIAEHPRFEAIEEAYMQTAHGLAEIGAWNELDLVHRKFVAEWPRSEKRPRMDLYAALSLIAQGQAARGLANLRSLAGGDTYEDVKADALYHLGLHALQAKPPQHQEAARLFAQSVAVYPRQTACLEAARCYIQLRQWDNAHAMLDRALRDFPKGDQRIISQARSLMTEVQKELATRK